MDAQKRLFLEKKAAQMDTRYWQNVAKHTSSISQQLDALLKSQQKAVISYFLGCIEIAETKYHGNLALLDSDQAAEKAVTNEYKEKLQALEQERVEQIKKIRELCDQLFLLIQQPFPLAEYNENLITEEAKAC
jgi:glutamine synthetase type III